MCAPFSVSVASRASDDFVKEYPFETVPVCDRVHHGHHGFGGELPNPFELGWVRRECQFRRFCRLTRADVPRRETCRCDVKFSVAVRSEKVDFDVS